MYTQNYIIVCFSDCAVKKESEAAQDDDAARALWEMSVKMVGLQK